MRSISFKLTLAFLLIGLTGAILVAAISLGRTASAFNQFILDRDQQNLVTNLLNHYQTYGNWDQVADGMPFLGNPAPHNNAEPRDFGRDLRNFVLANPRGQIIYSLQSNQIGGQLSENDRKKALTLEVDGETVGLLLLAESPRKPLPDSAEGLFLRNITTATIVSALVAAGLALVLGGLLALTLTRTLRELTDATVGIASGKLGLQVQVRSTDELGELAASFNKMSLDLEKATHARRQMTADIAHDLRSPLSVLTGYAEALSEGKLPGSPEIYDVLYQETRHLSHLVDDLRTLSLADAGELTLTRIPTNPRTILEREINRHTVTAQQNEIEFKIETEEQLPNVLVDPERIAQVLDNLIINAFRYTVSGGQVTLAAGGGQGKVFFQVRDTGAGIQPEDIPHIFDRFYRADKSRQENGESGLGLAIAKSIVEAHGGTIKVESHPGHGAAFTITFDALQPA